MPMKMPAHLLRAAMLQRLSHREPDRDQRGGPSDNDGDNIGRALPGMSTIADCSPAGMVKKIMKPMRKA